MTKLYGRKPIWLDEYGYQTDPPDKGLGVTPAKQARYLTQAVAMARANPRVTMLLWFLIRDEPQLARLAVGARDAKPDCTSRRSPRSCGLRSDA